MWENSLWGSRFYQLGRRFSFPALPLRELALEICGESGEEYADVLALLLLAHCRRKAGEGPALLAQMARRIWERSPEGKSEVQLARSCATALAALWRELRLPTEAEELSQEIRERLERSEFGKNLLVYTA